jgi:D-tyrosyl-tRNA(Tyr) deacylase
VRVVLQRVSRAEVRVDGEVVGRIGSGCVLLVAFTAGDGAPELEWMADKVLGLRVFADAGGKMNRSVEDVGGALLVVSQFTLYGDTSKGRRPSFVDAAEPGQAERLYDDFVAKLQARGGPKVETGVFGAMMEVELVNDGPVTLLLERA